MSDPYPTLVRACAEAVCVDVYFVYFSLHDGCSQDNRNRPDTSQIRPRNGRYRQSSFKAPSYGDWACLRTPPTHGIHRCSQGERHPIVDREGVHFTNLNCGLAESNLHLFEPVQLLL